MSAAPGDPAFVLTCAGLEKMPDPMIKPTTRDKPLRYVKLLCFSKLPPPFSACVGSSPVLEGAPIAVYPPAVVDESGNRFEAKSNADETE
jgi:hypothetical protein